MTGMSLLVMYKINFIPKMWKARKSMKSNFWQLSKPFSSMILTFYEPDLFPIRSFHPFGDSILWVRFSAYLGARLNHKSL